MTFTASIAREIESRFGNGEPFSKYDLVNISNAVGKADRAITHVLRDMEGRGALRIIGELKMRHGGTRPSKVYARIAATQMVPPADYRKNRSGGEEYERAAKQREAYINDCGIRLHEVLDGMTRARMQHV